jgi:hypothetical protein
MGVNRKGLFRFDTLAPFPYTDLTFQQPVGYRLATGCSKMHRYEATEIPRSESYVLVRRNDEG